MKASQLNDLLYHLRMPIRALRYHVFNVKLQITRHSAIYETFKAGNERRARESKRNVAQRSAAPRFCPVSLL